MLTQYNLKMPHEIYSGENAMKNLKDILLKNQVKKAAVFTDKGIQGAGLLDYPMEQIQAAGVETIILNDLPPEPTYNQAQILVDAFKASGADFIVAVGGGSVMDTAKLASILATDEYGVKDLLDDPSRGRKYIKSLMIPTTAGTGAEATPNAIVAVPEQGLKVGIVNDTMIAVQALDLILNNIMAACDDPNAMDAKNKMQIASFFAGVAITASGTTAVHALSYPLGGKYHIAHGVSNAILLAPVMRFNEPVCREKFAAAYDRCVHGEKTCATAEEKSAYLVAWMEKIVKDLDIPTSLKEFGVPEEDLDSLVEAGMQVTRLLVNNMREVTPADARALYQEIL